MTLKGHKSHFNVKFLKGYGLSVSLKNNKIILKDGYNPFAKSESEEWFIKNMPYEKIVLSGKGYISTEAITLLNQNNRNIILVDIHGKPVSLINGSMDSLTATHYRIGQYDTFRDKKKREYLCRQIVKAKIQSHIRFLKSIPEIDDEVLVAFEHGDFNKPITFEAKLGRKYFRIFASLIPKKFGFESRNQTQVSISKKHATDVINALLNYGYSVLAGEISKYVCGIGLDPYYGFYHKSHTGFQPLVYDLMEPFRWLVDYSVYKLANEHNKAHRIYQKDYVFTKDGSVILDYDLIKRFLELLERTFQKERRYAFRHGAKTKDGLKSCQEITIVKIAVQNLADFCLEKKNHFVI